jgi:hypothetical protein
MDVRILGVNGAGLEAGNAAIVAQRTIPWLQDTVDADVWNAWGVNWRDVVILDGDNVPVATFNLSIYDLAVAANYDSLKTLLEGIAGAGGEP